MDHDIDISKSLAELSGVDWGDPPAEARELVRERHELRRRAIGSLSDEQLRRFLDMGCDAGLLVPIALTRCGTSENLVLLLSALFRVSDYNWKSYPEQLAAVREKVYLAENLLSQDEDDIGSLNTRINLWRLYAEFERGLAED